MHQRLRLRGPGIEDAASLPEDLEDVGIVFAFAVPPANEAGVESFAFHSNVFLDADREAVERANRAFVLIVVAVEVSGSAQRFVG